MRQISARDIRYRIINLHCCMLDMKVLKSKSWIFVTNIHKYMSFCILYQYEMVGVHYLFFCDKYFIMYVSQMIIPSLWIHIGLYVNNTPIKLGLKKIKTACYEVTITQLGKSGNLSVVLNDRWWSTEVGTIKELAVQLLIHVQLFVAQELQHTRLPCPSWYPWVCSHSCPFS